MLIGVSGWALGAGSYPLMAAAVAVWGLGFASTNSMQQVRLVNAAPALASASVSLNTSVLYIGLMAEAVSTEWRTARKAIRPSKTTTTCRRLRYLGEQPQVPLVRLGPLRVALRQGKPYLNHGIGGSCPWRLAGKHQSRRHTPEFRWASRMQDAIRRALETRAHITTAGPILPAIPKVVTSDKESSISTRGLRSPGQPIRQPPDAVS